jgi:TATA-box binding protein (TBP) (component of TFIID and TFIIIB)
MSVSGEWKPRLVICTPAPTQNCDFLENSKKYDFHSYEDENFPKIIYRHSLCKSIFRILESSGGS